MFVDLWIFAIFALLFGFCAVFNFKLGVKRGIEGTLSLLEQEKIIRFEGEEVRPYIKQGENNV